jgi:type IV secretory pathway TrbL component
MLQTYTCSPNAFDSYYLQQAGSGINVFRGSNYQRGYGLGSILSGLSRMAIPILKSTAKAAGKHLLKRGSKLAADVMSGKPLKNAAKEHALAFGKSVGLDLLGSVAQTIANPDQNDMRIRKKTNKRKRQSKGRVSSRPPSKKKRSNRDIFS